MSARSTRIITFFVLLQMARDSKCDNCLKPVGRRLGLFQARDDYECYAEGYVKCFWGLCDQPHVSRESFLTKSDGKIITLQPTRQDLPYKNPVAREIMLPN